mgnify:CR=1 FL=1
MFTSFGFFQELAIDSSRVKDPSVAWKVAFIPGGGQIYNEDYGKAVGFWLLESYSIYKFNDYYNKENQQGKKNTQLGKRNTYAWWIIGLYVMSILDAYIDAHLSTFPISADELKDKNK